MPGVLQAQVSRCREACRNPHRELLDGVAHSNLLLHPCQLPQHQRQGDCSSVDEEVHRLLDRGRLDRALQVLFHGDHSCTGLPNRVYVSLLTACAAASALTWINQVYTHAVEHLPQVSGLLRDHLVVAFAKCGALQDADTVFLSLSHRTVFSWTAMISAHSEGGQSLKALNMYHHMQDDGVEPDQYTFVCLLQACANVNALLEARKLHADSQMKGFTSCTILSNTLMTTYGKCGSILEAEYVFIQLLHRDSVSWNTLLSLYIEQGEGEKTLFLYRQMQEEEVDSPQETFVIVLKACSILLRKEAEVRPSELVSLEIGRALHAEAHKKGFSSDTYVGCTLVTMYGNHGSIKEAENVFDGLSQHSIVAWNVMLSAYLELVGHEEKTLQLFKQMQKEGCRPNEQAYVIALRACGAFLEMTGGRVSPALSEITEGRVFPLEVGRALHTDAWRKGFTFNDFIASSLVHLYGKCGDISEAEMVFNGLLDRNLVSWTALLSAYVEQGHGGKALLLFRQMQEEGIGSDQETLVVALKACCVLLEEKQAMTIIRGSIEATMFEIGIALHADACRMKFSSVNSVGNTLVKLYGMLGSIVEAGHVYMSLLKGDVVSWNAMLTAFIEAGLGDSVLRLYRQMQEEGIDPNQQTFVIVFQACEMLLEKEDIMTEKAQRSNLLLDIGKALYDDAQKKGLAYDALVCSNVLRMYSKCGTIVEIEHVFSRLLEQNFMTWNILLSAYIQQGHEEKGLLLYRQMEKEGVVSNGQTFVIMLRACGNLAKVEEATKVAGSTIKDVPLVIGRALHADAQRRGFTSDIYVLNTLVSMYGNCGSIKEAEKVFDVSSRKNVVSWNAMLSAYMEQDQEIKALQLYKQMHQEGVSSTRETFLIIFQACVSLSGKELHSLGSEETNVISLDIGKALHADVQCEGSMMDTVVCSTLIHMYSKCGNIVKAEDVFGGMLKHNTVSWTAMISGYFEHGQEDKAILLYRQMLEEACIPNQLTCVATLKACANLCEKCTGQHVGLKYAEIGKALHVDILRKAFGLDLLIGNSLLKFYAKCRSIVDVENVFVGLLERDVVSWGIMLEFYFELGQREKALQLYRQMQEEGESPNKQAIITALHACGSILEVEGFVEEQLSNIMCLHMVQALHADASNMQLTLDVFVGSMLISIYGKCGSIAEAEHIFNQVLDYNIVTWNAMLSAYVRQGQEEKGLLLFEQIRDSSMAMDDVTLLYILQACSGTGSLEICMQVHFCIIFSGHDLKYNLVITLIRAYGNCASMVDAKAVFEQLSQPDEVAYNAFIAGHAQGGSLESLQVLKEMQSMDICPTEATFLSVLSACSHASFVNQGVHLFESMSTSCILNLKHCAVMLDLFGRAGDFSRAEYLLMGMPFQASLPVWLSLLGACCSHGNIRLGEQAFNHALNIKPTEAAVFVIMSNMCSDASLQKYVNGNQCTSQTQSTVDTPFTI